MLLYWISGAIVLGVVFWLDEEPVLRLELSAVVKYTKLILPWLLLGAAARFLSGVQIHLPPVPFWNLAMVWWEDAVFSLLLIHYTGKILPKWLWIPQVVVTSILFGLGHAYQPWWAMLILCAAPYFISYRIGQKHGWGSIMLLHVIYDVLVVGLAHAIIFLRGCL